MTRSNKNSNNFPPPPPPVFSPPEDRYHQLSEESDGVPSPPAFAGIFSPEELSMDNYASQSFHHPPRMDGLALNWEYQQPLYYDGSGSKSSTSPASSLESPSPPPLWSQPEQPLFSNGFSSMAGNVPGFVVPATPSVEFPDWQSPLFANSIEISLPFAPDIKKETDDNSRTPSMPPSILLGTPQHEQTSKHDSNQQQQQQQHQPRKRANPVNEEFHQLVEPAMQLKKVAHNAIERRYRNNINDRIQELKSVVPALYCAKVDQKDSKDDNDSVLSGDDDDDHHQAEIIDGVEVAKKLNKATILRKATEYITFLKHSNEVADRENKILQHILGQLPGGQQVLAQFLAQKKEFEQAEEQRLARERREMREREKQERQRILRERAEQRAAMAKLLPKRERKPYRRRKKPNQTAKTSDDDSSSRMFMAAYMCVACFSTLPFVSDVSPHQLHHHKPASNESGVFDNGHSDDLFSNAVGTSWSLQSFIWAGFYALCIVYFVLMPLVKYLSRSVFGRKIKCNVSGHKHRDGDSDIVAGWYELYDLLIDMLPGAAPSWFSIAVLYDLILLIPGIRWLKSQQALKSQELEEAGTWVRMSEVQCLGGDMEVSKAALLRSCIGLISRISILKRDRRQSTLLTPRTLARVHATIAVQLELIFGPCFALAAKYWRAICDQDMERNQVMHMVRARNGFEPGSCPYSFESSVLPYLTTPLDWISYWQLLYSQQEMWQHYILCKLDKEHDEKNVFNVSKYASEDATNGGGDLMIAWWTHLGAVLEKSSGSSAATSSLDYLCNQDLIRHDHRTPALVSPQIYSYLDTMYTAVRAIHDKDEEKLKESLLYDVELPAYDNVEGNVFALSTLAVYLKALDTFPDLQETICKHMLDLPIPSSINEKVQTYLSSFSSSSF